MGKAGLAAGDIESVKVVIANPETKGQCADSHLGEVSWLVCIMIWSLTTDGLKKSAVSHMPRLEILPQYSGVAEDTDYLWQYHWRLALALFAVSPGGS